MLYYVFIIILYYIIAVRPISIMEANIVGGHNTSIEKFPHSAALIISCLNRTLGIHGSWLCGSSVLNQNILMTAAHCFEDCEPMSSNSNVVVIDVTVGGTYLKDKKYKAANYMMHEEYDPVNKECDIALVYIKKNIKLGKNIKRVVVPKTVLKDKLGYIAGWGVTDDNSGSISPRLKYTKQEILSWHNCQKQRLRTAPGTICTRLGSNGSHAEKGDSGSALIVKSAIAIGVVSHKHSTKKAKLTVYTDVHQFHIWIKINAMKLYCSVA